MNWKSRIARIFLPSGERANRILQTFLLFSTEHFRELAATVGEEKAKAMYSQVSQELGRKAAESLRDELSLPQSPTSALDSWYIGCRLLGFRVRVQRDEYGANFHHLVDPLWSAFRDSGTLLCECTCVPMTLTMAQAFWPESDVEMIREPTMERPCIKRLVLKKKSR